MATNTEPGFSVYQISDDSVVTFAAQELKKYLQLMTGMHIQVRVRSHYDPAEKDGICLGVFDTLSIEHKDPSISGLDDRIWIDITAGKGLIAGINSRSVLLAVYQFLNAAGCRWVRPAPDGEFIPTTDLADISVQIDEKPSFRHRAICIEGAVSLENVLDIIDWSAKNGFSGYFMQFREGYTFFNRWYAHIHNPLKAPEAFSVNQAREFTRQIEAVLARRGMVYHAIGHGWTCEAFGIPGLGWDPVVQDWPDDVINSLAEVKGVRGMWKDIPLITSLCFSNPDVRKRVVDCVVSYLETHQNIQALHFWLDDGFNNKCECENCRKMLPSDYYVILLNKLDEALQAANRPEKIVFLSYADMLWAPQHERLNNPDRFIFMFAPITRSYRKPLFPEDPNYSQPPFSRNQLVFSQNNDEQLSFLRAWQAVFEGDSFIFDYHLWQVGAYTNNPDAFSLARLLHTDIHNLRALNLNGMVSCQIQRMFFPTGLAMYVMGRTLWNDHLDFEDIFAEYMQAAFGEDWEIGKMYLLALSNLQDVVPLQEGKFPLAANWSAILRQGEESIREFMPAMERNLSLPNPCQALSWHYLKCHAEMMLMYIPLLAARAGGDRPKSARLWQELKHHVQTSEDDLQKVFDVYAFVGAYEKYFMADETP